MSDFLKVMSRPAWVWGDKLDFPLLSTIDNGVKKVIYSIFGFDLSKAHNHRKNKRTL